MKRSIFSFVFLAGTAFAAVMASSGALAEPVRMKNLGRLSGVRENAIVGYGLVTGLAGTGDSPRNQATRQSLANMLSHFDVTIDPGDVQSRNVAAVMVTASLQAFARAGDAIDVTVTSVGDARSLAGGTLVMAPLKGPDGRVYALAQGEVSVGGYRYDVNGNQVQKNHPTVGTVPAGGTVEVGMTADGAPPPATQRLTFVLRDPDYTTAGRVADAINQRVGGNVAQVRDAGGIDIAVPANFQPNVAPFIVTLESVMLEPDRIARVVVNERTGTVVAGSDVRIDHVVVSHGDLKVTVTSETTVSQPTLVSQTGRGVRTAAVTNSQLSVDDKGMTFVDASQNTVGDLVQALARMRVSTRDVISILQAVKAAGALRAELVVQ